MTDLKDWRLSDERIRDEKKNTENEYYASHMSKKIIEWLEQYADTELMVDDNDKPVKTYFFTEIDLANLKSLIEEG